MKEKLRLILKRTVVLGCIFTLLFSMVGCSLLDDEETVGQYINVNETNDTNSLNALLESNAVRESKVKLKGDGTDTVTILIYMNGSDLESDAQAATQDLMEIVNAGSSENVNILVQTMGTRSWATTYGIASDRSQIYRVDGSGLTLVKDDLGQLDCTQSNTLSDFIIWGVQNYPADRYILTFWNHGGGPVYGFGYDEWIDDYSAALTIDEIQAALNTAGVYFDFIGMDCCIMSCMETCCALYDYCDYMILSEDFESGLGWYYTDWLKELYQNSSIPTPELAKYIIDDMVAENENSSDLGDSSILALIDESMMKVLYTAWTDFAYANESVLLDSNYSRRVKKSSRALPSVENREFFSDWFMDDDSEEVSLEDYYITDLMSVASSIDSQESDALAAAVNQAVVYMNATSDDSYMTGLSVTLPYGDSDFYSQLSAILSNCGFDSEYINWLSKFTSAEGYSEFYDYNEWDEDWSGWNDYDDDYNWEDWEYSDEDDYWDDDSWGWDVWDFVDSWNNWWNDDDWSYSDDWSYEGDDWYYGDDYCCDDDWYGDGYDDYWDDGYWDDGYDDWFYDE